MAEIDLEGIKSFKKVTVGFLQNQNSWIFLPTKVLIEVSADGKNYAKVEEQVIGDPKPDDNNLINLYYS